MDYLKQKFFVIAGPNVIESEEHVLFMAKKLKNIFDRYDINFIFKVSFDKANRSSLKSYRGLGFEEGLKILKKVKEKIDVKIITDIHESWQAQPVAKIVDIIQIPAFLCRQTDLLKAAAQTGKIIHVKKGQSFSADVMHKCKEKIIEFGNPNVILCERGSMYGYQDLVVDPRNLIWLKSDTNLVSMDITHCLQKPSQKLPDGTVKSGGYRELIPHMGKMAMALGVNGIFIEIHDKPEESKCDAPTQWPLNKLEWLLDFLNIKKNPHPEYTEYLIKDKSELKSTIIKDIKTELNYQLDKFDNINLEGTINTIKKSVGNIYFTGVGKSSNIANHCADLLKSISFKAHFLPITNLLHGDIGVLNKKDIVFVFSNSGNTKEIFDKIKTIKEKVNKVIGIFCRNDGVICKFCDDVITLPFKNEIDGLINNIPTNSCMSQLIFCNILISRLKETIVLEEYKLNHPSGNIGNKLLQVKDKMSTNFPKLKFKTRLKIIDIFIEITKFKMGYCCFLNENDILIGLLTDGDLRRLLIREENKIHINYDDINKSYYFITNLNTYLCDLKKYQYIPIIDKNKKILGVVHPNR